MILPQDIAPEKSMYVMGSKIIHILNQEPHTIIDPQDLYNKYSYCFPETKVTYNYFLYALDWLYIINAVELTEHIKIKKCY